MQAVHIAMILGLITIYFLYSTSMGVSRVVTEHPYLHQGHMGTTIVNAVLVQVNVSVAIVKSQRQVREASHRGSRQQQSSPNEITLVVTMSKYIQVFMRFTSIIRGHSYRITLLLLVRTTYIWAEFF